MRKPRISLRTGMSTVIVLCWLAPILLLVTVFGFLLGESYQRSARQEMNDNAQFALLQMQSELESAVSDSKSVSYDGVIRSAYRSYRESRNKIALYRSANEYLRDNFSRSHGYRAVFLVFWEEEVNANAYAFCDGESGSALIRDCQEATPVILDAMREEDTQLCFLLIDGQLYLTRNLLDSHFEPYATIVIMLRPSALFAPLSALGDPEELQLLLDGLCFGYDGEEGVEPRQEEDGYRYDAQIEGHELSLHVSAREYNAWKENPWLNWAAGGAALLVLPLLVLLWLLWGRHVRRPVETLVEANMKVQAGERGYEITQHAPNTEFETLFEHFNDMSAELKAQFERSYLEQQASQRAQIKALQSQIKPPGPGRPHANRAAGGARLCGRLSLHHPRAPRRGLPCAQGDRREPSAAAGAAADPAADRGERRRARHDAKRRRGALAARVPAGAPAGARGRARGQHDRSRPRKGRRAAAQHERDLRFGRYPERKPAPEADLR